MKKKLELVYATLWTGLIAFTWFHPDVHLLLPSTWCLPLAMLSIPLAVLLMTNLLPYHAFMTAFISTIQGISLGCSLLLPWPDSLLPFINNAIIFTILLYKAIKFDNQSLPVQTQNSWVVPSPSDPSHVTLQLNRLQPGEEKTFTSTSCTSIKIDATDVSSYSLTNFTMQENPKFCTATLTRGSQ